MWIDEREEKDRSLGGLTLKTSSRAAEKRDLPTFSAQGKGGYERMRGRVNHGIPTRLLKGAKY